MTDRVPYSPDPEPEMESLKQGRDFNRTEGHSFLNDSNYIRMCQFLNLSQAERENPKIAERVSFLSDWAGKKSGSEDETTRRGIVKKLWDDLGVKYSGEELVVYLYRYARLDDEKMKVEGEMNLYKPQELQKDNDSKIESLEKSVKELAAELENTEEEKKEEQPVQSMSAIDEARSQFANIQQGVLGHVMP